MSFKHPCLKERDFSWARSGDVDDFGSAATSLPSLYVREMHVWDEKVGDYRSVIRFLCPSIIVKYGTVGWLTGGCVGVENVIDFMLGVDAGVVCGLRRKIKFLEYMNQLIVCTPFGNWGMYSRSQSVRRADGVKVATNYAERVG